MSTGPLVVTWARVISTDPCCSCDSNIDMAIGNCMGPDITMASGVSAGSSHQAVPYQFISSPVSLQSAQTALLLSFHDILAHCIGSSTSAWHARQVSVSLSSYTTGIQGGALFSVVWDHPYESLIRKTYQSFPQAILVGASSQLTFPPPR